MESATPTPSAIFTGNNESLRLSPDMLKEALTVAIDEVINSFNRANNECRDKLHALAAACTGPDADACACASARAALLECVSSEAPPRDTDEQQQGNSA
ncbi:hypothetical protein ZWY2020_054392 [Hordeum vulgare]|nr:hypothetical protein ZWY2020_054392 [Hordeum vulgare]